MKNTTICFMFAVIALFAIGSASADTITTYSENITCSDNATLSVSRTSLISGVTNTESHLYTCEYGCTDNYCNPSPLLELFLIIGALILIIIIVLFVVRLIS